MNGVESVLFARYLFAPSSFAINQNLTRDELWKGIVEAIRKHHSRTDAFLMVKWFWSKKDLISAMEDQDDVDLDRFIF